MNSNAPASELRKAGIAPDGIMTHVLEAGTTVECPFAVVFVEFMDEITGGRVVFGPQGTPWS